MTTGASKAGAETELSWAIESWTNAVRSKDVDALMANYAADVTVFGISDDLSYRGWDKHRQHWEAKIKSYAGPIKYEMRDLNITVAGDVAFSHALNRIGGRTKDGETDNWIRVTVGYRKVNGKWLVTHEHVSVPFDGSSGKSLLDLTP